MTKYKCGHESQGMVFIRNDNPIIDYTEYKVWADTVGVNGTKEECLGCYYKRTGMCGNMAMPMKNVGKYQNYKAKLIIYRHKFKI